MLICHFCNVSALVCVPHVSIHIYICPPHITYIRNRIRKALCRFRFLTFCFFSLSLYSAWILICRSSCFLESGRLLTTTTNISTKHTTTSAYTSAGSTRPTRRRTNNHSALLRLDQLLSGLLWQTVVLSHKSTTAEEALERRRFQLPNE